MLIELTKFMSHEHSTVVLPDRGIAVVVGPNGAGKSAIVEAFAIALWGRGARSLRWQPWRPGEGGSVRISSGDLDVKRKWTGKAKQLQWSCGSKLNDQFDTTTKGQEALETLVGSFESWRRTCVFSSADAAHFTMSTDAERKELLEELLGLGWFDRALTACRKDLHASRVAQGLAEKERDLLGARADGAAKLVHQAAELLASTTDPGDVGLQRAELARVQEHIRDAERDIQTINSTRHQLLSVGGEALAQSRELRAKLTRLTSDQCFTCGQEIPAKLRELLEASSTRLLRESIAQRDANASEVDRLAAEVDELGEVVNGLQPIKTRLSNVIAVTTKQRDLRQRLRAEAEVSARQVLELGQQVVAAATVIEKAHVDVAELEACERVLGVRGARALLVGRTLSGIEALANTWMGRLGSPIEISLKPYTERKSGQTVDSISLGLIGAGGEAGYAGASAGERRRVDVSLLLALAELADGAAQGGRWRSPIFFDEVFDGLDDDGREAVMETVQTIAEDRLVVLITHDERLAADRADLRLRVDGGVVT